MAEPAAVVVTATAFSIPSVHRSVNQDAILLGSLAPVDNLHRPIQVTQSVDGPVVLAVADGLGGHPGGDVASRMVTAQLARRASSLVSEVALALAVQEVNESVYAAMDARPDLAGMGSTLATLVVCEDYLVWCNVGDSPAFVWDPPYLVQLSIDDVPPGPVTGRVTQTMGGVSSFTAIEPHVGFEKLRLPSRYLLCSDGLTKLFDLGELEGAMRGPSMRLAAVIAEEAVQRGCDDDCSVIIIDIDEGFAPGPGSPA